MIPSCPRESRRIVFVSLLALAFLCGCVDFRQEIYMNHDGSGKIVEKISIRPRGYRMMKGLETRKGKKTDEPIILSDAFFEKRCKSIGEVEIESKKKTDLPDGRKQVEVVYTFKDINKVHLWNIPTMRYMRPNGKEECLDGKIKFNFVKGPRDTQWGSRYREELYIPTIMRTGQLGQQQPLSPAERQKFENIVPIYQDVLRDFHISITIIPPIESFEERNMVSRMPVEGKNRVHLLKIDGKNLTANPNALRLFLANTMPSGGYLDGVVPRQLPGTTNPWFNNYHHKMVRFCKVESAPKKN